jgi:hypothetical protein
LTNVWYISQSPASLISQARLNDAGVYHDNETWILYDKITKQNIGYAPRWCFNFPVKLFNRSTRPFIHYNDASKSQLAVDLAYYDAETYEMIDSTSNALLTATAPSLTLWHKRLGHLNYHELRSYLQHAKIKFLDDWGESVCDSCERAKATKIYNRAPQERAKRAYEYIHTDLVGPITPMGFQSERYFVTCTDDFSRESEIYTCREKKEWLSHLQSYYSYTQTRTNLAKPIEKIRTDFGTELRSLKSDEWMLTKGIIFEPAAPYSQEQNGVAERTGRTLLDMARATILEGNIPDCLWPEVILAMGHTKNCRPTSALNGLSPYEKRHGKSPKISHLRVLGSTVYVFIHEDERSSKSAKFEARAQKGMLVGYDGHTIYRVYLENPERIIRVKDLRVVEDTVAKPSTLLPTWNALIVPAEDKGGKPILGETTSTAPILSPDQAQEAVAEPTRLSTAQAYSKRVNIKSIIPSNGELQNPHARRILTQTRENPAQTRENANSTRDPGVSARDERARRRARANGEANSTEALIVQLTKCLEEWDVSPSSNVTSIISSANLEDDINLRDLLRDDYIDPFILLAQKIEHLQLFALSSEVEVLEPDTYERAMMSTEAAQWSAAMEDEVDSLMENQTWELVPRSSIKGKPLGGKWVYRLKRDENNCITRFKARWVVKGYL